MSLGNDSMVMSEDKKGFMIFFSKQSEVRIPSYSNIFDHYTWQKISLYTYIAYKKIWCKEWRDKHYVSLIRMQIGLAIFGDSRTIASNQF